LSYDAPIKKTIGEKSLQSGIENLRELVARIEGGEPEAETELVRRYANGLKLILLKRTGNAHLSNDLVQETLVVTLRRLRAGELKKPESLPAFIRQTAINISIDHFRREKRYVQQTDEIISLHNAHRDYKVERLDGRRVRELLEKTLDQLSVPRDRELLRRYYLLDEDKSQICRDLDLSAAHFDRVLYRAKQRMRELISREKGLKSLLLGGVFSG
jgi:RNA polymerase sigma-70 factor (ECF subfamily)